MQIRTVVRNKHSIKIEISTEAQPRLVEVFGGERYGKPAPAYISAWSHKGSVNETEEPIEALRLATIIADRLNTMPEDKAFERIERMPDYIKES